MAFTLECPKCGSLNTASSFNPFKKVIQCATCGEEINTKQSRMISKTCHNCGKVVVCDQKKISGKKCPSCGTPVGFSEATAKYKMVDIVCPQCSCEIEVDSLLEQTQCPICNGTINVKSAVAKKGIVTDSGISVIKYEGDNKTLIWKHPIEDFNWGSQLIVHESQEAIFFLNGQALDTFSKPGKYTLETENLPVLKKAYKLPTGNQNSFHAEVYFVNKTVQMGIKWGTDSRVRFIDPQTGIPLDIGASGELALQVKEGRKLLVKLVGTSGNLLQSDIIGGVSTTPHLSNEAEVSFNAEGKSVSSNNYDNSRNIDADKLNSGWSTKLVGYFRPMIMTAVKSYLSAAIADNKINILEIDRYLPALSEALRDRISPSFEEYGLYVPHLNVTNVSLPEDDRNFKKIRDLMAAAYLGRREAEVEASNIAAQREKVLQQQETDLERAKFEAEKIRIAAQAEADKKRMQGFAEADVMAAQGYNRKDEIQADVQKAYAAGIGNMGSGSGGGGSMASDLLGLGIGMAAVGQMSGQVTDALRGITPQNVSQNETQSEPNTTAEAATWKYSCGYDGNLRKFCAECGAPKPQSWDCPSCGFKGNHGKFCPECGYRRTEKWDCKKCGTKANEGKFCEECGQRREDN